MEWIKNIKVGDSVITLERHYDIVERWKSEVIAIEDDCYIETKYRREMRPEWNHYLRVYEMRFVKNYFAPDGTINIEPILK